MAEQNLTKNERTVMGYLSNSTVMQDDREQFLLSDFTDVVSPKLKGTLSSLQKKGMIELYGKDAYFDGRILKTK